MTPVVDIYNKLHDLVLLPVSEALGVNLIDLSDPYLIGPELGNRIKRLGPQKGLNCIILAPLNPMFTDGDAAAYTKKIEYPMNIYFIFKRGETTLKEIVLKYANPLHDALEQHTVRRLGNLRFKNQKTGKDIGHVVNFVVGEPDFFPPDNDDLYPDGLGCFVIPVKVNYIRVLDPATIGG